jgi:hypothetical protein
MLLTHRTSFDGGWGEKLRPSVSGLFHFHRFISLCETPSTKAAQQSRTSLTIGKQARLKMSQTDRSDARRRNFPRRTASGNALNAQEPPAPGGSDE